MFILQMEKLRKSGNVNGGDLSQGGTPHPPQFLSHLQETNSKER